MNAATVRPGMFVTVEGVEGSGLPGVVEALVRTLKHYDVPTVWANSIPEPTVVKQLNQVLYNRRQALHANPASLMYVDASAMAEHYRARVLPPLQSGYVVIYSHYIDTLHAYHLSASNQPNAAYHALCQAPGFLPEPDLTFYVTCDARVCYNNRSTHKQSRLDSLYDTPSVDQIHRVMRAFEDRCDEQRFIRLSPGKTIDQDTATREIIQYGQGLAHMYHCTPRQAWSDIPGAFKHGLTRRFRKIERNHWAIHTIDDLANIMRVRSRLSRLFLRAIRGKNSLEI